MNLLSYPNEPDRRESDPEVISQLVRKGWTDEGVIVEHQPSDEELETLRCASIKRWAGQTILAKLPDWKQSNMHAESSEIILALLTNGSLTPEQEARKTVLEEWRAWSKAVRSESNRLEADLNLTVDDAVEPTPPTSTP